MNLTLSHIALALISMRKQFRIWSIIISNLFCYCPLVFSQNTIARLVTPYDFGAKGDGKTDDTKAFQLADQCPYDVFVPAGRYVVNSFEFASSKTWTFQRSPGDQWFAEGNARLLSSTTTKVTHGAKIYNLRIDYNGRAPFSNRPTGLQLTSHFCELHGVFISYFNVGLELGGTGHCDYTKIYDLYSWYNYFCGVKMEGTDNAQVNFVSFFDCNIASNGVSVHDSGVQPNTSRGYGFYIATANSVFINNADVSSNETAGIYIDNSVSTKQTRGLNISVLYAEHNKYCNIYYNNGSNSSPSNCRSRFIDVSDAYFSNNKEDRFFVSDVFIEDERFVPPTVSFLNQVHRNDFADGYSPDVERARHGRDVQLNRIYGTAGNTYRVSLTIIPFQTGAIVFQNLFSSYSNENGYYAEKREKIGFPFTIHVKSKELYRFTFYVTFPTLDKPLVYSTGNYGSAYAIRDCVIENITEPSLVVGDPVNGITRIYNGQYQVYLNGWKSILTK